MSLTNVQRKIKFALQLVLVILILPGLPLLIGADWGWAAAWILFLFQSLGFLISRGLLWRKNPNLFRERSHSMEHEDTASFDAVLMKLFSLLALVFAIVLGVEHRLGMDFARSPKVMVPGTVILAAGYLIGTLAMFQNPFFSGTVRIQRERNQHVVSRGVYSIVRHPGYAGSILYYLAAATIAGGWFTWVVVFLTIVLFVVRTVLEDRYLNRELDGYRDYSKRVKYRLLPGIW